LAGAGPRAEGSFEIGYVAEDGAELRVPLEGTDSSLALIGW
jgi:hypothetical protein